MHVLCVRCMCTHASVLFYNHLMGVRCRYLEDRHSVEVTGLRDLCTAHEQSIATMRGRIKDLEQRVEALSEAETDVEVCSCSSIHEIISILSVLHH